MWVLVTVKGGCRVLQHGLGRVAVKIERDHDRDLPPHEVAQLGQEGPFDILHTVGRSGPVQRQADGIDRPRRL